MQDIHCSSMHLPAVYYWFDIFTVPLQWKHRVKHC